jgi:hypothetical protein
MLTEDIARTVQESLGEANPGLVAWGINLYHGGGGGGQMLFLLGVQILDKQP